MHDPEYLRAPRFGKPKAFRRRSVLEFAFAAKFGQCTLNADARASAAHEEDVGGTLHRSNLASMVKRVKSLTQMTWLKIHAMACTTILAALSIVLWGCGLSSDDWSEKMRVTSPNGEFDAVLLTDIYGPAAGGGVNSNVYVVRKGTPMNKVKAGHEVLNADPAVLRKVSLEG